MCSDKRVVMDDDDEERRKRTKEEGRVKRHDVDTKERDGAYLFKLILYRIFILMDFFNSGPERACPTFPFFGSLADEENVERPRMTIPGLSYSR